MREGPSSYVGIIILPIKFILDAKRYFLNKELYPSPYNIFFTRYSSPYRILATTTFASKY